MSTHKQELIQEIAQALDSYGYTVYVSKTGEYGFYTDGKHTVCFGSPGDFCVNYSGNYRSKSCGSGWQIEDNLGVIEADTAKQFIDRSPPHWATHGEAVIWSTPEMHLAEYGASSGYVKFEGV